MDQTEGETEVVQVQLSSSSDSPPDDLQGVGVPDRGVPRTLPTRPGKHMKSFIAKRVNSILINMRYLRFKLLKYKENNKNICNTFDHNFKKYSFIYNEKGIIRKVLSVLYDGALTLKISKMVA